MSVGPNTTYRFTNGKLAGYPTQQFASSWAADWSTYWVSVDSTLCTFGSPLIAKPAENARQLRRLHLFCSICPYVNCSAPLWRINVFDFKFTSKVPSYREYTFKSEFCVTLLPGVLLWMRERIRRNWWKVKQARNIQWCRWQIFTIRIGWWSFYKIYLFKTQVRSSLLLSFYCSSFS